MDERHAAVADIHSPLHSGAWDLANLEARLAILKSAREGSEVAKELLVPVGQCGVARHAEISLTAKSVADPTAVARD